MTSKQRAYLKGLAMKMEPIMQLGKGSVTPENTAAVDEALAARELIKISVLQNCLDDPRQMAEVLAERTHAQVVQVIGRKIVLYREGKKDKKKAVASQNEIKDFIFIHKISPLPEAEMSYMDLSEYGNETEILKPLSEYRKEQEEKNSQKTEESEAGSMEDLIAMMNKRFK